VVSVTPKVRPPVSSARLLTARRVVGRLFAMRIIVTARVHPVMAAGSQLHDGRPDDKPPLVRFNDGTLVHRCVK
jgi:hypothetical protein